MKTCQTDEEKFVFPSEPTVHWSLIRSGAKALTSSEQDTKWSLWKIKHIHRSDGSLGSTVTLCLRSLIPMWMKGLTSWVHTAADKQKNCFHVSQGRNTQLRFDRIYKTPVSRTCAYLRWLKLMFSKSLKRRDKVQQACCLPLRRLPLN